MRSMLHSRFIGMLSVLLALCLAIATASSCTIRVPAARQRSNYQADLASPAGLRMTTSQAAYGADADRIDFTIVNETDQAMLFGAAFTLETLQNGSWYMVPYKGVKAGTEMTWPAIAYQLPARGTATDAIRLTSLDGIGPGDFRLIKEVFPQDGQSKTLPVVARFTIKVAASQSKTIASQLKPSASQAAAHVPTACERLWSLDPGREGFSRTNAYRVSRFACGNVALELFALPQAFDSFNPDVWERIGQGGSNATRFWKKSTPDGTPYYVLRTAVSWDATGAPDETGWRSGTTHTQSLHLEQGGLGLTLNGSTGQANVSLDIVSLDTLRILTDATAGTAPALPECEAIDENWRTDFQNGNISLSVTVIPPPFDIEAYAEWAGLENVSRMGTGDAEYFMSDRLSAPDSPNAAAIAYRSEIGLVEVRGGVPYRLRNEIPRETLDFITIDYVRDLIARIR